MKKLFAAALLALPFLAVSAQAEGWPWNVNAGGSFYIQGGPSAAWPQAGPWYLYWPLEAHFVAPAPTGYPYWPSPQGLPRQSIGGPAMSQYCAPYVPRAAVPAPPPAAQPAPQPLGPRLQPASYYYPVSYTGTAPSYWYDR
jgi:hypothetical protein